MPLKQIGWPCGLDVSFCGRFYTSCIGGVGSYNTYSAVLTITSLLKSQFTCGFNSWQGRRTSTSQPSSQFHVQYHPVYDSSFWPHCAISVSCYSGFLHNSMTMPLQTSGYRSCWLLPQRLGVVAIVAIKKGHQLPYREPITYGRPNP